VVPHVFENVASVNGSIEQCCDDISGHVTTICCASLKALLLWLFAITFEHVGFCYLVIPAKERYYVFTGVGLSCLSVCLVSVCLLPQ